MSIILTALLVVHAVAHLPGFVMSWRGQSARPLGVLWLLIALTFLTLAVAVWLNAPWWRPVLQGALAASVLLCVTGWPDARFGIVVNAVIAGLLIATPRSWFA